MVWRVDKEGDSLLHLRWDKDIVKKSKLKQRIIQRKEVGKIKLWCGGWGCQKDANLDKEKARYISNVKNLLAMPCSFKNSLD